MGKASISPDNKTWQRNTTKRKFQAQYHTVNIDAKSSIKYWQTESVAHQAYHHDHVYSSWDARLVFNICKSKQNVIHHINRTNNKNTHDISIAEKAFEKIQHCFMLKTLND